MGKYKFNCCATVDGLGQEWPANRPDLVTLDFLWMDIKDVKPQQLKSRFFFHNITQRRYIGCFPDVVGMRFSSDHPVYKTSGR